MDRQEQQGRVYGTTVAEDWAGAVTQKTKLISIMDGRREGQTDGPTQQGIASRVRD